MLTSAETGFFIKLMDRDCLFCFTLMDCCCESLAAPAMHPPGLERFLDAFVAHTDITAELPLKHATSLLSHSLLFIRQPPSSVLSYAVQLLQNFS
jgi:hypothetical protein